MSDFHSNWINMNGMINTIELHRNVGRRVRSIRNAHCFNNFEESYCNWRADSIYPVFRCYSKRKDADANAIINELKRCPIKVVVNKCYDSNEHYCLHWYLINQSTSLCIQLVPMLIISEYSRLNANVHLRFRIAILWNVRFMCGLKQSYTQIKVKKKIRIQCHICGQRKSWIFALQLLHSISTCARMQGESRLFGCAIWWKNVVTLARDVEQLTG